MAAVVGAGPPGLVRVSFSRMAVVFLMGRVKVRICLSWTMPSANLEPGTSMRRM